MRELITRLIHTYGNAVTVTASQQQYETRAFMQLVTSKSWQNMERMLPSIGEVPRGQFLYLGPADVPLSGYDTIEMDGRIFIVRRADPILYRSERIFIWGLCVEGGSDDPWV